MAIIKLFSQREAEAANLDHIDVYQYDKIPSTLRVQIKQISVDALGKVGIRGNAVDSRDRNNSLWAEIEKVFLRENGLEKIGHDKLAGLRVLSFLDNCTTTDWLDLVELIVLGIHVMGDDRHYSERQE
ncbi:AbiJ-NTD4 domain-containing protein [Acetobacter orleanensis]|uniref:HEPN AbiJ-N-terminal domain-containing protein n=1 Tax=Acetobacter orleanensis TaxID=104099 RepID=A0A4Y3TQX2_9PROT|nr:hypothetical protein [Acetobacter orleanensis]KXV67178.1 hypothetical protein AD949_00255 [Acetobacter orleanensis]PCD78224.1 hypothetical protein CO710_13435 [Acetobacter orleanensis]GAN69454.1 hypothetical protein Abol_035_003 [Acetobacter orleanensis JCM 7639]GBR28746.1 hypothetical protein AA0473_1830 [Acetobacter orleanensis NRIC 0473]GEB84143.1 hypothetical protein AOR01nite_26200 [Acetobacter orleanensis]